MTLWLSCIRSGGLAFAASLAVAVFATTGCTGIPLAPSSPAISEADLRAHVTALTDERADGRATGTEGEAAAADWLARAFSRAGLVPAGTDGDWRHAFEFTAGVSPGPDNRLTIDGEPSETEGAWRPLAFSRSGTFADAPVVFVGYGLVARKPRTSPGSTTSPASTCETSGSSCSGTCRRTSKPNGAGGSSATRGSATRP